MNYKEIANRITGISCPLFGASWNPPTLERDVVRRLIIYLEDKRVLYSPYELEVPSHCIESIVGIRETLTRSICDIKSTSHLSEIFRGMRASCRRVLDKTQGEWYYDRMNGGLQNLGFGGMMEFFSNVGVWRGEMGVFIVHLLIMYGINCESDLLKIVPLTLPED